jgi:hypothetical protein
MLLDLRPGYNRCWPIPTDCRGSLQDDDLGGRVDLDVGLGWPVHANLLRVDRVVVSNTILHQLWAGRKEKAIGEISGETYRRR